MKRRFLSLLCALALLLAAVPSAAALEGEARRALEVLTVLNIAGNPPADSALKTAIPRGEAAVLLLRFSGSGVSHPDTALTRSKAAGWLKGTSRSIGEISALCGYPNQLHFSRAFKKRYGVSPREWRNQNRQIPRE